MSFTQEFNLLLKARYPIIYVTTIEEDRLEYTIRNCIKKNGNRGIYIWDFVEGYINNPNNNGLAKRNPLQALEFIEKIQPETPAIFLLKDFNRFLNDVSVSRKLKNLIRILKTQPKTLIIVATEVNIPNEFIDTITILEFQLPQLNEIKQELDRLVNSLNQKIENNVFESLINSCQGLSLERIRRVLSKIIALHKTLDERAIDLILKEKRQIIYQTQVLEFCLSDNTIADIGGLTNLKNWLTQRAKSFSNRAKNYGLPAPRGLLLIGIQGTGKSLTAKAIANDWQLPLLKLDFGRLFGGIVGESEMKIRQMIQIAETLAPCILWIDEIDKTFGQINSKGDSGTTSRVLGTFITWLSEKTAPVFVVSTANNFDVLPVELIRKGRFDEIFFIGLPLEDERKLIFTVHLSKLRPDSWKDFNIDILSQESKNFSGAEIQQSIIEGMHIAFNENREFTTNDIRRGLQETIPIAKMNFEEIESLQNWALSGRFRIASTL
jgi:ATP-dependent 26S proteasome regulatory subunit|tara:strand:+ start:602 stop:2080 length:1479 start_codon:yes stop_codon:yes gene_type:complete